jgi:hypothetical protein
MTKNVFVIGAGASKELNLPTGLELKQQIISLLSYNLRGDHGSIGGDNDIRYALSDIENLSGTTSSSAELILKTEIIKHALPYSISIDNLIDAHRDDPDIALIGKVAITRAILKAESNSYLADSKQRLHFSNPENANKSWLLPFFQSLTENCTFEQVSMKLEDLSIICFNYDRCIERYLLVALNFLYKAPTSEIESLVMGIEILRPYGSVGNIFDNSDGSATPFGAKLEGPQLFKASKMIKTFTEGTDPNSSDIKTIRDRVLYAKKLFFLGFGYHKLNMKILSRNSEIIERENCLCLGSAFGESTENRLEIEKMLRDLTISDTGPSIVKVENLTCRELIDNFSRAISSD